MRYIPHRSASCLLLAGAAAIALSSCAADPTVRYQSASSFADVTANQSKLVDTFYLQGNELAIDYKPPDAAGKPAAEPLSVANRKTESTAARMMLLRGDPLWTRTTVNLVKVDNTDLIKSAGVEVTDRRADLITNAATIVKTLAPLAVGVAGGTPPCEGIDPSEKTCRWSLPATSNNLAGKQILAPTLAINWGEIPKTAIPTTAPQYQAIIKKRSHGLYYAACREVVVSYAPAGGRDAAIRSGGPAKAALEANPNLTPAFEWRGKVADPRYVEYVAFPRKGSIEFHTQCGVSVKTEKDPTQTADALLSTAITQAVAVKEAVDKAEEAKAKADEAKAKADEAKAKADQAGK